ncbi:MAG: hypothetical protein ACK4GN_16510 [Runella sp.]
MSNINVLVYQLTVQDTLLTQYAITNRQGFYKLTLASTLDTFLLTVKTLGFGDGFFKVLPTDSVKVHDFVLIPKPIQLREVTVKNPPVRTDNDTTTYKVKNFIDGTERNVEELLRKLPGIQVADNGKITAFGKAIDKVMIEGEDLFSKNYQIITKSLAANALERVEVIENYHENPLLKDIEKSSKVVLNLGVRADLKIRPFGNATATIGYKNRYAANAIALTLVGKLKAGLVGNLNNIGSNPVELSEFSLSSEDDWKAYGASRSNLLAMIPLTIVQVPNIESQRVSFNRAALVGGTYTYNINPKLKIKGFSYLYDDRLRLFSGNFSQYFFEEQRVTFRDSSIQTRLPNLWANQFKAEYSLNAKTNLKYTFNLKRARIGNNSFLDTKNAQLSEEVLTNGKDNLKAHNHLWSVVTRLNDKNALVLDGMLLFNDSRRLNQTQSLRYANFFGVSADFKNLTQSVAQNQGEVKSNLVWKNTNRWGNLSAGIGYLKSTDHTITALALSNEVEKISLGSKYKNDLKFENQIIVIDLKEDIQWKRFKFNIGVSTQWIKVGLTNHIHSEKNFEEKRTLFQPTLGISARVANHQNITLFYFNQQQAPLPDQFTDGFIQSNYRSFGRNEAAFFINRYNQWHLSYNNTNWAKLYAINLGISYGKNFYVNTSDFIFSDLLNLNIQQPIATKLNQWSANWQLDRLISTISTKIRLEGFATRSDILNRVNGSQLLPNVSRMIDTKIYAISAFDSPFNFQISTRINYNQVINRLQKQLLSEVYLIVPNITLKYKPMKELSMKLIGEQLNWYNQGNRDVTNLLDMEVFYRPQKSIWGFSIRGNNLLNTSTINYTYISNFSIYQNSYVLQPRWLSVSASCSF